MPKDPFKLFINQDKIKDQDVTQYYHGSDVDDFIGGNVKSESLKISLSSRQLFLIILIILASFFFLFGRIFYVQVAKGGYYRELAEGNRLRILGIPASRGLIYDRNLNPLSKNIPNFFIQIIPSDLPEDEDEIQKIVEKIAEYLSLDRNEVANYFSDIPKYSYQPQVLKELLDPEMAVQLKVKLADLPGISLEMSAIREYQYADLFAHVLGYTGKMTKDEFKKNQDDYLITDYIGKSGLEIQYEDQLKGKNGKKEIEVDSFGQEKKVIASQAAELGQNLVSTLDLDLQQKLADELQKYVVSSRGNGGAAVALDPRNGEVLALVSSPSFDTNKFVQGISANKYQDLIENQQNPLFFKAISGEYPSGSTIKPLIAAAALQEGIITPATTINSVGGI
ncbi:hypothetical protein KKI23_04345, partial [Patescibacteria group bacterium]|nr:hypothetical protein [Patescibacteria group bacterium]